MIDETQRQLDYIDGQLALGTRDPKDVELLKKRRKELIEQRTRRAPAVTNFRDRQPDARQVAQQMARAARATTEGNDAA